jgi:hypothetical protein
VADVTLPSTKATSAAVSVSGTLPPTIDHFTLTGLPATDLSGAPHTITITAVNAGGQTVTGYTGTVHVTSSDSAIKPFDVTFTPANKGVVKTSVTLTSLGVQSLTARDGTGHTGAAGNILVVSPATQLGITASATKIGAGGQITLTVKGLTTTKATDTLFADTLLVTTSDPNAMVVAGQVSGGMETFMIRYRTAGTQTISVTDLTRPALVGSAPAISVTAGGVSQLGVTGFPLFAVAGSPQSFTVTAQDAYGNTVLSGFTDTVQVAGQSYTFKPSDHGKHVFTAAMNSLGTKSLTATDTKPGVHSGTEANITVVALPVGLADDPDGSGTKALIVVAPAGSTVLITPASTDGMQVFVSMTVKGKTTMWGPFSPTGHIIVCGQGNNVIEEVANSQGTRVAVPAILLAGPGNTTLSAAGSRAGNVLVGGPGADVLVGGSGADILIGGGGPASLHAGTGGDLLISGSTTWDNSAAALAALLKEWSRPDRTYLERVHDLLGDGSGGLNGTYLLDPQTVLRDTAVVQLFGGKSGMDWFWLSEGFRSMDRIYGFVGGEVGTFE